jgi:hypothetical protein
VVASGTALLNGIACPKATKCEVVGENDSDQGVVLPLSGGTPGTVQVLSGGIVPVHSLFLFGVRRQEPTAGVGTAHAPALRVT